VRKTLLSLSVAAALATPGLVLAQQAAPAAAPASPHTFTGNVGFASDYRFRGISQTFKQPAIQGGFDYSHASGFYAGTWASNVYGGTNASALGVNYFNGGMEWDLYGGYKFEPAKDLTLDVGLIYYAYPGAKWAVPTQDKYNNTEIYLGASYKWLTAKYSRAISDYFGMNQNTMGGACGINASGAVTTTCLAPAGGSKGSSYLDLGATFELGAGFNLVAHVGRASVRHYGPMDYTDYKIGVTKDWLGLTWGAAYIDTNAKADVYRTAKIEAGGLNVKDTSNGTLVLTMTKTF
jgi:uncharacterized protein (TIGR02001 family)